VKSVEVEKFLDRKDDYKTNRERNLVYLIPSSKKVDFEDARDSTLKVLKKAIHR